MPNMTDAELVDAIFGEYSVICKRSSKKSVMGLFLSQGRAELVAEALRYEGFLCMCMASKKLDNSYWVAVGFENAGK